MSIKALVSNYEIYNALLEELDGRIEKERKTLESLDDPILIYRSQGVIKALRKLKQLKEEVNGR